MYEFVNRLIFFILDFSIQKLLYRLHTRTCKFAHTQLFAKEGGGGGGGLGGGDVLTSNSAKLNPV